MNRHAPQFVIEPGKRWSPLNLSELWSYRELVGFLAWRDISIRYKQTALGALWAIVQPLLMTLVFTIVFGKLAKVSTDGVPYVLFGFTSALCWQYFSSALTNASGSLLGSSALLTKVYFPRLVIPIASVLPACLDFAIAFTMLCCVLLAQQRLPTLHVLWLPVFCLLALVSATGIGLWFSALSIEYRDVKHILPFATQLLLFISPVAYPASLVPKQWLFLYSLNPLVGAIEGFRWCLLGTAAPSETMLSASAFTALTALVSGLIYFRNMESTFADVV
jgi:lipopolysaccharide transport system permease protein